MNIKGVEPNGRDMYSDIIDHPHWQSPTRPRMSLYNRAAQFASFDALAGYSDMVAEEARVTGAEISLDEQEKERLNQKLNMISNAIGNGQRPVLAITYFVPDPCKQGGEYVTVTEEIRKIDSVYHKIILTKAEGANKMNAWIDFEKIIHIQGPLVDFLDDITYD